MAEAALFIGWGLPARGQEKAALDVFTESLQYWGRLKEEGQIESFDVAVLVPHGTGLRGFVLLRGTAQQLDSLGRSKEFRTLVNRVNLRVDQLEITDAYVDEGLAEAMSEYQDEVGRLTERIAGVA